MKTRTTGALIALALAAAGTVILACSRSFAVEAAYPIENASHHFSGKVWTRIKGFFQGSAACAENARLKREVASLMMIRGTAHRLETENARLRRALGYIAREPETWLAAGVLSRGGGAAATRHSLRVDKGTQAGVREGMVVAVPEGLVGRVTAVTPHTSEVTLITDPSLKVACQVEKDSKTRLFGILAGGDEDGLVLKHLKIRGGELPSRSKVLTSGRGGVFPAGIEVGILLDVRKDSQGLAREGEVLPLVAYSTLEDVFIRREK